MRFSERRRAIAVCNRRPSWPPSRSLVVDMASVHSATPIESEQHSRRWLIAFSYLVSGLFCVEMAYIGYFSPEFAHIFTGFRIRPVATSILRHVHLWWTLPVGILIAVFFVWKDSRLGFRQATRLNAIGFGLLV